MDHAERNRVRWEVRGRGDPRAGSTPRHADDGPKAALATLRVERECRGLSLTDRDDLGVRPAADDDSGGRPAGGRPR